MNDTQTFLLKVNMWNIFVCGRLVAASWCLRGQKMHPPSQAKQSSLKITVAQQSSKESISLWQIIKLFKIFNITSIGTGSTNWGNRGGGIDLIYIVPHFHPNISFMSLSHSINNNMKVNIIVINIQTLSPVHTSCLNHCKERLRDQYHWSRNLSFYSSLDMTSQPFQIFSAFL